MSSDLVRTLTFLTTDEFVQTLLKAFIANPTDSNVLLTLSEILNKLSSKKVEHSAIFLFKSQLKVLRTIANELFDYYSLSVEERLADEKCMSYTSLLCELLSVYLLTVGVEEEFPAEFTKQDYIAFSRHLNQICFVLCWEDRSVRNRTRFIEVLRQVYRKRYTRQFI